jgi:hypothetical protein
VLSTSVEYRYFKYQYIPNGDREMVWARGDDDGLGV